MVDISALTPEEQRELYDRLAFTLDRKSAPPQIAADDGLYNAIKGVLSNLMGKRAIAPFPQFIKSYTRSRYDAQAAIIMETLDGGCGRILRRAAKMRLLEMTLESLVESMVERNIPVSPGTVLDQANFFYIAVNKDYPGYISSKMLHRLVPMVNQAGQ